MAEYQKKLNFSLNELVPFRSDQLVREIQSASLEPNVVCHEHGQYVILRGKLVFCGEYFPQDYEVREDYFAEQNVADVFANNESGYYTFNYSFPVDITVPLDRILSTDELSIGIDNFDCSVQENGYVSVSASLFVEGVYERDYVEHLRQQNIADKIPAYNAAEEMLFSQTLETNPSVESFPEESIHQLPENQFVNYENNTHEQVNSKPYEQFEYRGAENWLNQNYNPKPHSHTFNENQNPQSEQIPQSNESYDEQITYRTTYDYDPWNQHFNNNNNTYSQSDYYRNPYEATYGGAGTQYYKQTPENFESNNTQEATQDSDFNQYVKFNPSKKPDFISKEEKIYDIKFTPEHNKALQREDAFISFENPHIEKVDTDIDRQEPAEAKMQDVDNFSGNSTEEVTEVQLDIEENHFVDEVEREKEFGKKSEGFDKVVFPFADEDNMFEKSDEYEFLDENIAQPEIKTAKEEPKYIRPEIGKSKVVSDIFSARGKAEKNSCLKIYIVQRGDSLEFLAEKYSTNANKIAKYNQLQPNDKIVEGQVIYIPE